MPKCAQCGKDCNPQRSFNWNNGVAYLCSEKCEKESASWRLARYTKKKEIEKHAKKKQR